MMVAPLLHRKAIVSRRRTPTGGRLAQIRKVLLVMAPQYAQWQRAEEGAPGEQSRVDSAYHST